jgi:hypothetical protein
MSLFASDILHVALFVVDLYYCPTLVEEAVLPSKVSTNLYRRGGHSTPE